MAESNDFDSLPLEGPDSPFPTAPDPRLIVSDGDRTSSAQAGASFYPAFTIKTVYIGDTGLVQMPVAGPPGTPARTVRKSAPYAKKIVFWTAARLGEKPVLPHYSTGNVNEVLAKFFIIPQSPVQMLGGSTFLWLCEGIYVYYLSNPPCFTDDFYTGTLPLYNATVEELKIQGYEFSHELLRSQPPAPYTGTPDQQFLTSDDSSILLGFLGVGR